MALSIADFSSQTGAMVTQIKQLATIESPTSHKPGVDRIGAFVTEQLRTLGADVTVDQQAEAGNNVYGCWGSGGILILCHMDTVHPLGTLARQPLRELSGRLFGPGVYDMKASITLALTALRTLRERSCWPARPVTALFTSDEETGSAHSRALIEQLAREATLVLCLEPGLPDGALKTERKGVGEFTLIARGRSAHAGTDHKKGLNAIEELAHHILAAQALTDYEAGTTVNVGVVRGGTRPNVVPDEAMAEVNFRVATMEAAEQMLAWMRNRRPIRQGVSLTVTGGLNRGPMVRDATMRATFARAQVIGAGIGLTLTEGSTGGGSDGSLAAALGVPVLDGLGPQGDGAHTKDEHLVIISLAERAALLAALITEW